ncbi:MAG TPA: Uma2 family endonuclease [Pyrinomonadaceae bacterium]|nr:Uma2 family endonuclease [Pyrinomonadaceae bacterium]
MTTIAELEKLPRIVPKRFRVEDFRRMTEAGILPEESGWEIIDGYLIDKMSIGSKHASIVRRLSKLLERKFGDTTQISGQNPVYLDEFNEPEPDIALLKPRDDFYEESHPTPKDVLLLIEVSNSTIEFDRDIKKTLYAEAGIVEYWIVNLPDETVEVYSQLKNGNYHLVRIIEKGEMIESNAVEKLKLTVEEILGL